MDQIIEFINTSRKTVQSWSHFESYYDFAQKSANAQIILNFISGGEVSGMLADILSEKDKDILASEYKEVRFHLTSI